MNTIVDMIGKKFGRLTAVEDAGSNAEGKRRWRCLCDCGNFIVANGGSIRRGLTRSCGCLMRETSIKNAKLATEAVRNGPKKHGMSRTSTHNIWKAMIQRATGHGSIRVRERYEGKTVCASWRDFRSFLADMGVRPDGLTLDRIDNDGGYWCGKCDDCLARGVTKINCRWTTYKVQADNKGPRRNKSVAKAAREAFAARSRP